MTTKRADILKLQEAFLELTESEFGEEAGWYTTSSHRGVYSEALTIWLMMVQALHSKSLSGVLSCLEAGMADEVLSRNTISKKARRKELSTNTGGYSHARERVGVEKVGRVTEIITAAMFARSRRKESIYFLDGTLLTLQQTPRILEEYPAHKNNCRTILPQMRVVFASDYETGVATYPSFAPVSGNSEQSLCMNVLERLETGSLVVADRNFGVFSVASRCSRLGHTSLVRLTNPRALKVLKREEFPSKPIDEEVEWEATRHDKLFSELDPKTVKGRVISQTIERKGFKPVRLTFFTTSELPAKKLLAIYSKRQDIETDIRYLKTFFNADYISAKTPPMLHKELLIRFAAYNLIRSVVAEGAIAVGLGPREVSFSKVCDYALVFAQQLQRERSREKQNQIWDSFLTVVRQSKLPKRTRKRSEPRQVVRRDEQFPKLYGKRETTFIETTE